MIATSSDQSVAAVSGQVEDPVADGRSLLLRRGRMDPSLRYGPESVSAGGGDGFSRSTLMDATATALMELYRDTRSDESFEALVASFGPALTTRIRTRLRCLGSHLDPDEVLQDVFINVYRYPGRFDGSRPGAFRAWSSMIVDNTIRRQLRNEHRGPDIQIRPIEQLSREADAESRNPLRRVQVAEDCQNAFRALRILLCYYLNAFQTLSDRERFVLQMVEVRGMRYAPLADVLGIRPEALKMVVFRARRRILDHVESALNVEVASA